MGHKESSEEVSGEWLSNGQGEEAVLVRSACAKALRQHGDFEDQQVLRVAVRGFTEAPYSCDTFLKSSWESQKVLVADVMGLLHENHM